mmetsp:Transcript_5931/g.20728  ORF Transcript_5931/g.20728 Transcript_5931/m.20728 type:complete len:206 (-) Transcript_5931:7882-8499(-)
MEAQVPPRRHARGQQVPQVPLHDLRGAQAPRGVQRAGRPARGARRDAWEPAAGCGRLCGAARGRLRPRAPGGGGRAARAHGQPDDRVRQGEGDPAEAVPRARRRRVHGRKDRVQLPRQVRRGGLPGARGVRGQVRAGPVRLRVPRAELFHRAVQRRGGGVCAGGAAGGRAAEPQGPEQGRHEQGGCVRALALQARGEEQAAAEHP